MKQYDWSDPEQRTQAAILIRNFVSETYLYHFKSRAVFDVEELANDVVKVVETGGLNKTPNQRSMRAETSGKAYTLFIADDDEAKTGTPKVDLTGPGPLEYDTEKYKTIKSNMHKGVNMGRAPVHPPNWHPPSPTPGPQDYRPAAPKDRAGPIVWQGDKGKERDPRDDGPGPAIYDTPDIFSKHLQTSPPKSLTSRAYYVFQNSFSAGSLGPGPAGYETDRVVDLQPAPPQEKKGGGKAGGGPRPRSKQVMEPVGEEGSHASAVSARLQRGEKKEIRNYSLSTFERPPAHSFSPKTPKPQHMDPEHKNRRTPGPRREAFYAMRNGREVPIEELTLKKATPVFSMMGTPTAITSGSVDQSPDPGTYNIPSLIGGGKSGPSWSMGVETTGRSKQEVCRAP